MSTRKNPYRVPKKQWNRWSEHAQDVFTHVYSFMSENPEQFLHPKQELPKSDHWKTTAWNAAWVAADAVDETR